MKPLLRFDGVTCRRGGRLLFEDLDIQLGPGAALQVTGPNGSGKSSLIRLAAGLLAPERGTIERGPLALADDALALDRELALEAALRFWGGDVHRGLSALGLAALAQVPVRLLSSGQAKRSALARIIASGAPLWLLDEPSNTLDSESWELLGNCLDRHRASGGAVLAASHSPLPGEWATVELAL
jgi:heme exporter protein A